MANITSLLEVIRTAHLGRDMRAALHDAIETVNNDTETALGKSLAFTSATRKLSLKAKDGTVLSEVVIPGGGSGGGSVDSVNGLFPDENGNVELNLNDINDVDITSVSDGDALVYDAELHKWVNGAGGGGTTDYTDLTNKPSVNGVTLSGNKTSADLGLQSALTFTSTPSASNKVVCQNDLPSGGGSNRNLLDNPWFTVNQRGASGTVTSDYQLDRWRIERGSITINSDGTLTYGTTSYQVQYANLGLVGKQVTFSALLSDGTIESVTFNVLANTYNNKYVGTHAFSVDTRTNMQRNGSTEKILFYNDDSSNTVTIKAMKLEFGAESTLAQDTEPNYTTELLKCQRHYYPLGGKSYNAMVSAMQQTRQFLTISLPTEMRAVPTLSGSLTTEGISGSTRVENTVTSSNITVTKTQDIDFNFTTSGNYNLCSSARVSFASGSYLSAEL